MTRLQSCVLVTATFLIIGAILALFHAPHAHAHSASSGMVYDPTCCGGQDCHQLTHTEESTTFSRVTINGVVGYSILPTHEFIPSSSRSVHPSTDGNYHWCHNETHTYCIYIPPEA